MTDALALVRAAVPLFEALRTRRVNGQRHTQDCRYGLWLGAGDVPYGAPCGGRCKLIGDWLALAQACAATETTTTEAAQLNLLEID